MRKHALIVAMLVSLALATASCGGGGSSIDNPPSNFTRLTAQVLGSDGSPMANLAVRVEGQATGVSTDASGSFSLGAGAFPNGINVANELSVGRDGVVLGNQDIVPAQTPDLTLRFGDNFGLTVPGKPGDPTGPPNPDATPGSLSGNIYDETTTDPLDGVEVTLYSTWGDLLMATSSGGTYQFASVMPGEWRLLATKDGYNPETAAVTIAEGEETVQHLAMVPKNVIPPGDGVYVKGTVVDSQSGAGVPNASISMYVDTGYYGVPEPAVYNDVMQTQVEPDQTGAPVMPMSEPDYAGSGGQAEAGSGQTEPGTPTGGNGVSPSAYEPQYLETTTDADGNFSFDQEVIGYSLWLEINAEGYMPGSDYEYIEGQHGYVNLGLTLEPFVATDVSGTVVDNLGAPVANAYVEFVYAGNMDVLPLGMAVPGGADFEEAATNSREIYDEVGAPVPPATPNDAGGSGDWNQWGQDAMAAGDAAPGSAEQGSAPSGMGVDNPFMQRYRWENQQGDHSSSDAAPMFTGYYSTNTDDNGEFSFSGIPAGNYYVFASAYQHLPYSNMLEVAEDAAQNNFEITCANAPVGIVAGVITDENGAPVADALVNATQPYVDPFSYSDESGHYRIENVPAGTWTISAYKQGFLTRNEQTEIVDGGTATVNLIIDHYTPPAPMTIDYSGHVTNGTTNGGVVGADMVFTPVNNEYGGWFQHVQSGANGAYSTVLIPTEYNVLIQKSGYQDLYMRIWVDSLNPTMDFWLWEPGSNGGPWGGGGGGIVPLMEDTATGMPARGQDDG